MKNLLVVASVFALFFSNSYLFSFAKSTQANIRHQATVRGEFYGVKRIHGRNRTISGTNRTYVLYIPISHGSLPKQPFPVVVMVHGFFMSSNQQGNTCRYLAERGFMVLAPNMSRIMWGSENRTKNVNDVVDQMAWLVKQNNNPKSPYFGLCDPKRIAIAGNSSGGAICFECVLRAQEINLPFHTMCSMEGVPWDRTLKRVKEVEPMDIFILRAEPCLCNYHWNVLKYVKELSFSVDDVKVNGAHHCDAENPTTIGCMSVCGTSHKKYRQMFQLITYLYLRDSLDAPRLYEPKKSCIEVFNEMQQKGEIITHLDHMQGTRLSSSSQK